MPGGRGGLPFTSSAGFTPAELWTDRAMTWSPGSRSGEPSATPAAEPTATPANGFHGMARVSDVAQEPTR